jgi:hypothetical protein
MLAALRNTPDSMSMSSLKDLIDPNMMDLYPHDCVFKVNALHKMPPVYVAVTYLSNFCFCVSMHSWPC